MYNDIPFPFGDAARPELPTVLSRPVGYQCRHFRIRWIYKVVVNPFETSAVTIYRYLIMGPIVNRETQANQ